MASDDANVSVRDLLELMQMPELADRFEVELSKKREWHSVVIQRLVFWNLLELFRMNMLGCNVLHESFNPLSTQNTENNQRCESSALSHSKLPKNQSPRTEKQLSVNDQSAKSSSVSGSPSHENETTSKETESVFNGNVDQIEGEDEQSSTDDDVSNHSTKRNKQHAITSESEQDSKETSDDTSVEDDGTSEKATPLVNQKLLGLKRKKSKAADALVHDLDLKQLLKANPIGKGVLASYKRNNYMTNDDRRSLADIICPWLLNCTDHRPANSHYEILADKICKLFPNEDPLQWYVAPKTEGPHQKCKKGRLPQRVKNAKRKLVQKGALKGRSKKGKGKDSDDENLTIPETEQELVSKEWLRRNYEPFDQVKIYWGKCRSHRLRELILSNNLTPSKYVEKWHNLLKLPEGYQLVLEDLEALHKVLPKKYGALGGKADNLMLNWTHFSSKVVEIMKTDLKRKEVSEFEAYLSAAFNERNTFQRLQILKILPSICKLGGWVKVGRAKIKPSTAESRDAFVLHVTEAAELQELIRERRDRYSKLKAPMQPYIAVVTGEESVTASYVVIDDILWKVSSVLKAVEVCWKACFSLNCDYSREAQHLWLLVQKALYNISLPEDPVLSSFYLSSIIMFTCFVCKGGDPFLNADSFLAHIQVFHASLMVSGALRCTFKNCVQRQYDRYNSFRKHVKSHKTCQVVLPKLHTETCNLEGDNSDVFVSNLETTSESTSETSPVPESSVPSALSFDDASTSAVVAHIATMYDAGLTETQVQTLIDSQRQLLGGPFILILKKIVLGIIQNCCTEKDFQSIACMFDSLTNMFDSFETTYKRMNEFESCGSEFCNGRSGSARRLRCARESDSAWAVLRCCGMEWRQQSPAGQPNSAEVTCAGVRAGRRWPMPMLSYSTPRQKVPNAAGGASTRLRTRSGRSPGPLTKRRSGPGALATTARWLLGGARPPIAELCCGSYVPPEPFVIGQALIEKNIEGNVVMEPTTLTGQFIPTRKVLKGFLELPGVLSTILQYMEKLESDTSGRVENILQGTLWKEKIKPKFEGKIVLPIVFKFDDYEPNKSLGAHAGVYNLGAGYAPLLASTIPRCTREYFLSTLFHTCDKFFGNEKLFRKVLAKLKFLEEKGIYVVPFEGTFHIFFALCIAGGDNKGANEILGFASFFANFFCRICSMHRSVAAKAVCSDPSLIRTRASYEREITTDNLTLTGRKGQCIFNELESFHVYENSHLDIMHDLDEGVWKYVMTDIVKYFVEKVRFSLVYLNERIQGFHFGPNEERNKPPLILPEHLKRDTTIKCSASEMRCLVRYFSLMTGHLVLNADKPVWNVYLKARSIVDIVTAPSFSKTDPALLKCLIREHHTEYLRVFKTDLKPKFHMMTHIPEVMSLLGPLEPLSCIRIEAEHKKGVAVARKSNNRINLPKTVSTRYQLDLSFRLLSGRGLVQKFDCSRVQLSPLHCIPDHLLFSSVVPSEFTNKISLPVVKWVRTNGMKYQKGSVVLISVENRIPLFGVIHSILLSENNDVSFILKLLNTEKFDLHYHSYEVSKVNVWKFVNMRNLHSYVVTEIRTAGNGKKYVSFRYSVNNC
ncbi:LOW QUALITY PROTEIN: Glutamate racemase 2 [Frankliniella fusca]|uniref:Glutamate racemase 2 n=1 Tax=Frankliniella fusca TaxID=407009 RepID=A0AAE1LWJ0_9NEOP|nr:LOW QUALITY PROTEIN: Glutamate racemase 2 [Frankliniella fusca]